MRVVRAVLACALVVAVGLVLVSGGSDRGPHTPPALPGLSPPFLGVAVTGGGGLTAAVDAYGDIVDLRAPGPAGAALIDNPSSRQAVGTVPAATGIVPRVRSGGGAAMPMWRADSVIQTYVVGTNVVRTVARFGGARVLITAAASETSLALIVRAKAVTPSVSVNTTGGLRCVRERRPGRLHLLCRVGGAVPAVPGAAAKGALARACAEVVREAAAEGRRWLRRSRSLGTGAPAWARAMYRRSLLTIRALTSRRTGAVAAGARDGWAYVWPRDAATAALALEASGHRAEARSVARFLAALDLGAAARFDEAGVPVPGRAAQGDATGWVTVAARATSVPARVEPQPWRDRADYQESFPGAYLGNALAASVTKLSAAGVDGPKTQPWMDFSAHQHGGAAEGRRIRREFGSGLGLVRAVGDQGSGLDSAAGWAVRPFRVSALFPAAERTLLRLVRRGTPYGITPGEGWTGGEDPWTAPTAWSAWALAGLAAEGRATADRHAALRLLGDLRRASTPAGDLPERVGVRTGIPTSTTPLLWSSAFAVLALRELWP